MANHFRALLIPGWICDPETTGWGPWLIKQLSERGVAVKTRAIPHAWRYLPQCGKAVAMCQELVPDPDERTIICAHSYGARVACEYVSSLNRPIGGLILIAPLYRWAFQAWLPIVKPRWSPLQVRNNCRHIRVIHSADDYLVPYRNGQVISQLLQAPLLTLVNHGHFAPRDNCFELPVGLQAFDTIQSRLS